MSAIPTRENMHVVEDMEPISKEGNFNRRHLSILQSWSGEEST